MGISYDVATSIRTYRFAIGWRLQDNRGASYVGIHYLYILKYEDDEYPDIGYGGDGLWTPGIHVGIHQNPLKN